MGYYRRPDFRRNVEIAIYTFSFPGSYQTDAVESNCLAHGRRHIVDEVANFPVECRWVSFGSSDSVDRDLAALAMARRLLCDRA